MSNAKDILQIRSELTAMPEFALSARITAFSFSINIFRGNYNELRNAMLLYYQNPNGVDILTIKNRDKLSNYQNEILRLFHNFLASASSLIDHARVLYNELYKNDNLFPDYIQEVNKRFVENPLAQFIVDLRHFMMHVKALDINAEAHWALDSFSMPLTLDKASLDEYSGWKAKAKEFLNKQEKSIDLLVLIDNYHNLIIDFYKWFFDRQNEIHSEQFKRVQQKQNELQRAIIDSLLETEIANIATDESFLALLKPKELEDVNRYDVNDPLRCESLVKYLEKRTPLSNKMKEQIKEIYKINRTNA